MPASHITEKPSYRRYYLSPGAFSRSQVLHWSKGESSCFHIDPPPKHVSHRIVKESLPHQQAVFWSEWVSPSMLPIEKCWVWVQSLLWKVTLVPQLMPVSEVQPLSSLHAITARGGPPFISKSVSSQHAVGEAEEILLNENLGRDLVSKLTFLAVQNPCMCLGHSWGYMQGEQISSLEFYLWFTCFMSPFGTETQGEKH